MDKNILGAGIIGGIIGGTIASCLPKAMNYEQNPKELLKKFKDDDDFISPETIEPEDLGGDDID